MIILDEHISPGLALWINSNYNVECYSAKYLGLQSADDQEIFSFARSKNAVGITKDDDFVSLLIRKGSPPKVTCGNTSIERLKDIFRSNLSQALELLRSTDLVEITGR